MKIAAVVTLYNPDLDVLRLNIVSYLPWVDHLIIWGNSPVEKRVLDIEIWSEKIKICSTGKNEYLAVPFNKCIEWARNNDCDYILTMDQDSRFEDGMFASFTKLVEASTDEAIAIFAPATKQPAENSPATVAVEKGSVYSSGSIYKRAMFEAIGGFREDLAIYCLDTEICMRARKNGFRIVQFPHVYMEHTEGYKALTKSKITINNYSAQSTYFYVRNNLMLWKIYPDDFSISAKYRFYKYHVAYRIAKMIFETDRISKLKAIFVGVWHGIKTPV